MNLKWIHKDNRVWVLTADAGSCRNKALLYSNGAGAIWIESQYIGDGSWRAVDLPESCSLEEKKAVLLLEYRLQ